MIRLIQRKLIIPRGDTGSLSIPVLTGADSNGIAVFSIIDPLTQTIVFKKKVTAEGDTLTIELSHDETVNLPVGKFKWDIKYYINPVEADGDVVDGTEVNSYYAAFGLPECEIRQTADRLLMYETAPLTTIQLNIINAALAQLAEAVRKTQENVSHYPVIRDSYWYVWDADTGAFVNTNVRAEPDTSEMMRFSDMVPITNEQIQAIIDG